MSQESTPVVETSQETGIQQGLADRTEAMKAIAQARENLGAVASAPVVTNGEVLTPKDREAELHTREVQGHAYQR